ncbi:MAG: hypothetical protein ACP5LE_08270, partial [Thermoplasmata archaeon]
RWEAQWFNSSIITINTTFVVSGCGFMALPNGQGEVYAEGNIPLLGTQECYYRRSDSGSYTKVTVNANGNNYDVRFSLSNLEEGATYLYYVVLRCVGGGVAQSSVKSVVYQSPKITGIVWEPEHGDGYEKATITWKTSDPTTNNYVSIGGKIVSASGNGDTTHTAYVTGLNPSTYYVFTMHSKYGSTELTATGSGYTRMVIKIIEYNENWDASAESQYFYIIWATGDASPWGEITNYFFTYQSSLGSGTIYSDNFENGWYYVYGYWHRVKVYFSNPQRLTNQTLSFTISGTYTKTPQPTTEVVSATTRIFKDTDGDGLFDTEELDYWEVITDKNGDGDTTDPGERWGTNSNPRLQDTDRDWLTDYEEKLKYRTDPRMNDTDGDSETVWSPYLEDYIVAGTDANDPEPLAKGTIK